MKSIVITTGKFSLIDASQRLEINKNTPTVVRSTPFVEERLAMGHLRTLAQVSDDATQAELVKYVKESDGDLTLAVAAFVSAFDPYPQVEPAQEAPAPVEPAPEENKEADASRKPRRGQG